MTRRGDLSEDQWREVLRNLFEIKGRSVRIPQDTEYTVEDADFHGLAVDSVPAGVALEVLHTMARAMRVMSPEALETLLWLAAQTDPRKVAHEDLQGRGFAFEDLEYSVQPLVEELLESGMSEPEVAEELGIPVEWVDSRNTGLH